MTKQVIMISAGTGPRSGKTTLKSWLGGHLPGVTQGESFADPLKDLVAEFLEMWLPCEQHSKISSMVYGDLKEIQLPGLAEGITPRRLMQTLGTEWRELIDKDLWVKMLLRNLGWGFKQASPLNNLIVDDLRFRHELTAVKAWCEENGVKLWHIRVHRPSNNYVPTHASEMGVFEEYEVDLHLYNDGTKEEFLAKLPEGLAGIGLELK